MTRAACWLTDVLSQLLESHERDAVRGDLAECRVGEWRALLEILGLVARRQASYWVDWRPWLSVMAIVLPIGLMLSYATRWWADANAFDFLVYRQLRDFSYLDYPGWRRNVGLLVWSGMTSGVALAGWSWTSGYVLASLSPRARWSLIALFALVLFLGTLGNSTIARTNSAAFSGHFVGVVIPRVTRFGLVLLPALWGMHCSRRRSMSRAMLTTGSVALIVLTLFTAPSLESSLTLGRGVYPSGAVGPDKTVGTADDLRPLWPITLVMLWPTAAILFSTWRRASASS